MKVMYDNFSQYLTEPTFIALGSFDGIHRGHKKIINTLKKLSNQCHVKSMVYTFKNHPRDIVKEKSDTKKIMTVESKIDMLEELGIDIVNFATFDKEYMKILPEDFIKKLIEHYNMKGIVVGFNNRFGYKNTGDTNLLKQLGRKYDFEVIVIDGVTYNNEVISSTLIRNKLDNGEVEEIINYLERPYSIEGVVVEGKKIGRTIGFPTANITIDEEKIIPKGGVYYTKVKIGKKFYKGITNIGYNPTVNGNNLTVETHILDFDKDIYGEKITVYFFKRIRSEKKFNSIDELKERLKLDYKFAKKEVIY